MGGATQKGSLQLEVESMNYVILGLFANYFTDFTPSCVASISQIQHPEIES